MLDPARNHFLKSHLTTGSIKVLLVGCGGNGAQMLMGLASLDHALRAMTSRYLTVTVADDDVVTEANLGRQPFYPCDVGRAKAYTLVERINVAYGLRWSAVKGRVPECLPNLSYDLIITCVDTAAARRAIHAELEHNERFRYWLDLGNRARDGQYVLGTTDHQSKINSTANAITHLPTVIDMFPELADASIPESDEPSCSLAEALEKQSLFVNRTLASHALDLLYNLLCRGSIAQAGGFMNLATGHVAPITLPKPADAANQKAA